MLKVFVAIFSKLALFILACGLRHHIPLHVAFFEVLVGCLLGVFCLFLFCLVFFLLSLF